jgi:hypothetical protein
MVSKNMLSFELKWLIQIYQAKNSFLIESTIHHNSTFKVIYLDGQRQL